MNKEKENSLYDVGAERSVLAGIIRHGANCFYDICGIIKTIDFYKTINQKIFVTIKHLIEEKNIKTIDFPTMLSTTKTLSYENFNTEKTHYDYLESLFDIESAPSYENTLQLSTLIYKLSLSRQAIKCIDDIKLYFLKVQGNENIDSLISRLEEPIFNFTAKITEQDKIMGQLTENLDLSIKNITDQPKEMVGLSTGFPKYDFCIGGGLRKGTVNVLGARAKGAKSMMCLNIAKNLARHNVPVLYLDTELTKEMQLSRLLSLCTKIEINQIETGKFAGVKEEAEIMNKYKTKIEQLLIYHASVAGQSIDPILSLARRWIIKNVGLENNGLSKPCLIIYDYLKLMNTDDIKGNMQEHQLLGFIMTNLHNFALKFGIPIFAAVQLNRDGVDKEGGHVISASDRILWLCSNFSILKNKSDEELKLDPPSNGTKKLIITDTRCGAGMSPGEYINIQTNLKCARLDEGEFFPDCIKQSFKGNEQIKE